MGAAASGPPATRAGFAEAHRVGQAMRRFRSDSEPAHRGSVNHFTNWTQAKGRVVGSGTRVRRSPAVGQKPRISLRQIARIHKVRTSGKRVWEWISRVLDSYFGELTFHALR